MGNMLFALTHAPHLSGKKKIRPTPPRPKLTEDRNPPLFLRAAFQKLTSLLKKGKLYAAGPLWDCCRPCKQPLFAPAPCILTAEPQPRQKTAPFCAWPSPERGKLSINIFIFMVSKGAERKALILRDPGPLPSSRDPVAKTDLGVASPTPKLQAAAHDACPQEVVGVKAGPHCTPRPAPGAVGIAPPSQLVSCQELGGQGKGRHGAGGWGWGEGSKDGAKRCPRLTS